MGKSDAKTLLLVIVLGDTLCLAVSKSLLILRQSLTGTLIACCFNHQSATVWVTFTWLVKFNITAKIEQAFIVRVALLDHFYGAFQCVIKL